MKKLWLMLVILVFTVSLLACTKKEDVVEGFPENDSLNWGIKLSVKDISSKGLTIVFEQSGESISSEFLYGEDYNRCRYSLRISAFSILPLPIIQLHIET